MLTPEENLYVVGISSLVREANEEIVALGRRIVAKGGVRGWSEEEAREVARAVDRVRALCAEATGFARQSRLSPAKAHFDMGLATLVKAMEATLEAVRASDDRAAVRGQLYFEAAKSSLSLADLKVSELGKAKS